METGDRNTVRTEALAQTLSVGGGVRGAYALLPRHEHQNHRRATLPSRTPVEVPAQAQAIRAADTTDRYRRAACRAAPAVVGANAGGPMHRSAWLFALSVLERAAEGRLNSVDEMREFQWTRPELVVQIRFVEWTAEGRLRHSAFLGLRTDKRATEVRREE